MFKPLIVDYAERTAPEVAYKNNTPDTRKIIEADVVRQMQDDKEMKEILAQTDCPFKEEIFKEFVFLSKWLLGFKKCGREAEAY